MVEEENNLTWEKINKAADALDRLGNTKTVTMSNLTLTTAIETANIINLKGMFDIETELEKEKLKTANK